MRKFIALILLATTSLSALQEEIVEKSPGLPFGYFYTIDEQTLDAAEDLTYSAVSWLNGFQDTTSKIYCNLFRPTEIVLDSRGEYYITYSITVAGEGEVRIGFTLDGILLSGSIYATVVDGVEIITGQIAFWLAHGGSVLELVNASEDPIVLVPSEGQEGAPPSVTASVFVLKIH